MVGDCLNKETIHDKAIRIKTVLVKKGITQHQGAELGEGVVDYQIGSLFELPHIL